MKKMTYALSYLIIAFLFIAGGTVRAQNVTTDFENLNIGDAVKGIGWSATDIIAVVALDPLGGTNKVLKNSVNNYNAAPVLAFTLPAGKTLADYKSFTFKSYWAQGDVGYKDIVVEAYQSMPTAQAYNNAANKIGSWNRAKMGSTAWEDITVDITNTRSFSGTIYIAFGINCAGTGDIGGTGVQTIWYADNLTLVPQPVDTTIVAKWGFLGGRQGNWKFTPGSAPGSASIGGDASLSVEWGAIRGEFNSPITTTTANAILVTGTIEFVGAGIDTWSGLRYGLFNHTAAGTLITSNVDSTRWSGSEASCSGYMFSPVSGSNRVTDGVSGGLGTEWIRVSGNYISTGNGSGPIYLGGLSMQKPARAVADAGVYEFAFSVQPLANGTKEVRFYLIKGSAAQSTKSTYYFGDTFIDTTTIAPTFNGIVFAVHATGSGPNPNLRGVKLSNVKATIGTPFALPEAPWSAYYVDQWGFIGDRMYGWTFTQGDVTGNATIGGTAPNGKWAAVRGGFDPVSPTTAKALLLTGKVEFVGGGFEAPNSFRFGTFYSDKAGKVILDTAKATLPDSTHWDGLETYTTGYLFIPPSGTNGLANWTGVRHTGSSGAVVNGAWLHNDYPAAGTGILTSNYVLGQDVQTPANAVAGAGVYNFTISVASTASGANDVRYKLAKSDNSYSITGKLTDANIPPATTKFNSVNFAIGRNFSTTAMKFTDVKVDYVAVASVPIGSADAGITSVGTTGAVVPSEFTLAQNYPNPFNPSTTISYDVSKAAHVSIRVYDVLGRMVAQLVDGIQAPSRYTVQWNPAGLSSGTYLYRIDARNEDGSGNFTSVKKLIYMK